MGSVPKRIVIIDDQSSFLKSIADHIRRACHTMGLGFDTCPGLLDWDESEHLTTDGSRPFGVHIIAMTHEETLRQADWCGLHSAFIDVQDNRRSWLKARYRGDVPKTYLAGIDVVRHLASNSTGSRLIVYSAALNNPYLWLPLYESTCRHTLAYYHVDSFLDQATVLSAIRDPKPSGTVEPPTVADYKRLGIPNNAPIAEVIDELTASPHWSLFAGATAYRDLGVGTRRWLDRRAQAGFDFKGGRALYDLLRRMSSPEDFPNMDD
jgi:hypothetical protein